MKNRARNIARELSSAQRFPLLFGSGVHVEVIICRSVVHLVLVRMNVIKRL